VSQAVEDSERNAVGWAGSGSSEERVGDNSDVEANARSDEGTGSGEVAALRNALRAANERLALYEGFDRLIEDQVRRASETVREVVALRDEVAHGNARARLDAEVEAIAVDIRALAVALESLGQRVDRLRSSLGHGETAREPVAVLLPEDAAAGEPGAGPPTIDLIVHQVPDTATAVSLQRFVSDLEPVDQVDVREFAEGLLRLRLTVKGPLDPAAFSSWDNAHRMQPLHHSPALIELAIDSVKKS
jgi:hypothetical protein